MTTNIALLLDDLSLLEWERQAVAEVLKADEFDAEISLILTNRRDTTSSTRDQIHTFISEISLWKVLVAARIVRRSINDPPWYRTSTSIETVINTDDVIVRPVRPNSASGVGNELPEEAVSLVGNTDVAIRFGFGILKGDVLDAPTHGVLSYHHGDMTKYRGRPAGFYEFINEEPYVGVTVQRLSEKLDAGEVAATRRSNIEDCKSLNEVRKQLFEISPPMLSQAISHLIGSDRLDTPESLGPVYSTPTNSQVISYMYQRISREYQR
jgi:methionyl-tRNA formyltransferase